MTVHNFILSMKTDKWYKMPSIMTYHNLSTYAADRFNLTIVKDRSGKPRKIMRLRIRACIHCGQLT